jgi:hypothetical protein
MKKSFVLSGETMADKEFFGIFPCLVTPSMKRDGSRNKCWLLSPNTSSAREFTA